MTVHLGKHIMQQFVMELINVPAKGEENGVIINKPRNTLKHARLFTFQSNDFLLDKLQTSRAFFFSRLTNVCEDTRHHHTLNGY